MLRDILLGLDHSALAGGPLVGGNRHCRELGSGLHRRHQRAAADGQGPPALWCSCSMCSKGSARCLLAKALLSRLLISDSKRLVGGRRLALPPWPAQLADSGWGAKGGKAVATGAGHGCSPWCRPVGLACFGLFLGHLNTVQPDRPRSRRGGRPEPCQLLMQASFMTAGNRPGAGLSALPSAHHRVWWCGDTRANLGPPDRSAPNRSLGRNPAANLIQPDNSAFRPGPGCVRPAASNRSIKAERTPPCSRSPEGRDRGASWAGQPCPLSWPGCSCWLLQQLHRPAIIPQASSKTKGAPPPGPPKKKKGPAATPRQSAQRLRSLTAAAPARRRPGARKPSSWLSRQPRTPGRRDAKTKTAPDHNCSVLQPPHPRPGR